MNTKFKKFHHITGDPAYLIYWQEVYNCEVKISSLEEIDQNLEVIVSNVGDLVAYRCDYPIEMSGMVKDDGEWHVCTPETLIATERDELQTMMVSMRLSKYEMN